MHDSISLCEHSNIWLDTPAATAMASRTAYPNRQADRRLANPWQYPTLDNPKRHNSSQPPSGFSDVVVSFKRQLTP
jgi:hypothetical protein